MAHEKVTSDVRKALDCWESIQGFEIGIGHCWRQCNIVGVDGLESLVCGKLFS